MRAVAIAALALIGLGAPARVHAGDWIEDESPLLPEHEPTCGTSFALADGRMLVGLSCAGMASWQGAIVELQYDGQRWRYEEPLITAADGAAGAQLGAALALDGETAIACAPATSLPMIEAAQGAAFVFTRSASGWTETQKLSAPDGHAGDSFCQRVALSGDTAAIVAQLDNDETTSATIYLFARASGRFELQAMLTPPEPEVQFSFGSVIALDGDTLLVGLPDQRGPDPEPPSSVLVYTRSGETWSLRQELVPAVPDMENFGYSLALRGDTALIGSPVAFAGTAGVIPGGVYEFRREGGEFVEGAHLIAKELADRAWIGAAVALDGDTAVVGASEYMFDGAGYVFTREGASWSEQQFLKARQSFPDGFGATVGLSGDYAFVGGAGSVVTYHRATAEAGSGAAGASGVGGGAGSAGNAGSGVPIGNSAQDAGAAGGSGGRGGTSANACADAGCDDSGAAPNAGSSGSSGCGCRLVARSGPLHAMPTGWLLAAAALIAVRRRRSRRVPAGRGQRAPADS